MEQPELKGIAAWLIALMLVILPIPAAGESLTLGNALEIALSNNPDLKLASVNRQSSDVEVSRLKAARHPTVTADLGASEQFASGIGDEHYETASAGITARYNLYDGGADRASLEGALLDSSAAGRDLEQERQTLFLKVAVDYLDVLSSTDIIDVRQEDLSAARIQLERVKALYEAGSRPVADLYQQQASVKEAELSLLSAQRDLEVNHLQLIVDLGLDKDPGLTVSDPAVQGGAAIKTPTDLGDLVESAMATRRDIAAQEARVEAARNRVTQYRAGRSVNVDLYGSISTDYSSQSSDGLWDQMGWDNIATSVGVNVSWPLYDAQQTNHSVRQAELNLLSEQVALNRPRQEVRKQLGQALEDYLSSVKGLEVSTARLQWAEKALESVSARYGAGAANLVELNDARSEAVQARYDVVSAQYDCLSKALSCAYYQGGIESAIRGILTGGKES